MTMSPAPSSPPCSCAGVAAAQAQQIEEIPGPGSVFSTGIDLANVGYTQEEFFLSRTAHAYTSSGPRHRRQVERHTGGLGRLQTRIVVNRPASGKKFNGTVVVEWLNVGGVEAEPDWTFAHTELIRQGYAWVGVSAQKLSGSTAAWRWSRSPACPSRRSTRRATARSAIRATASRTTSSRRPGGRPPTSGPSPLGDLGEARHRCGRIAVGLSHGQLHRRDPPDRPRLRRLLRPQPRRHQRATLESPQPAISVPGTAAIRDDVDVPVLIFETESDLTFLGYVAARQDDTRHVHAWSRRHVARGRLHAGGRSQ
jgi:hypothetical protein